MLPGRKYTPEDLLRIARRRVWFLLVPAAVAACGAAIYTRTLPDQYLSETLILVVPQRVPESYVRSTVTSPIEDRLNSISQLILSRTRLERIIQEFNLYEKERRTQLMEDVVEKMRANIWPRVVGGNAFTISYTGEDPRTIAKVVERLASFYIEENLKDREVLAEGTSQFLDSQLQDAKRRLIEHEKRLEVYRRQHSGELPSQLDSNLQVIQSIQMQIQALVESIHRDRDRRLLLERMIADANIPQADAPVPSTSADGGSTAQQLDATIAALRALELRLKPDHPDVITAKRVIRTLEKKAEAEALQRPLSADAGPTPAALARQNRLRELYAEIENLDKQIGATEMEEKRLRAVSAEYQTRVDGVPGRESELVELTRDYTTLQEVYTSLLGKQEDSKIAANLERRQIGEQFKLLDPARVPQRPFSPNRARTNLLAAVIGLGLGAALVALLEYRDTTLRIHDDVSLVLNLPVIAMIPVMRTAAERRRLFYRKLLVNSACATLVLACAATVAWALIV